ncbi:MAG TPA: EAL domain-containing protein, partial [Thermomicrobiales bacterium]|nr:EAL domain-containing protein [Thermomicrobiales bacterium]
MSATSFLAASPAMAMPAAPQPNARQYAPAQLALLGATVAILPLVAFVAGTGWPLAAAVAGAYLINGLAWIAGARRAGSSDWRWRAFLLVGLAVIAAYAWLPAVPYQFAYATFGVVTVAAIAGGIRIHQPARSRAWMLLATGLFIKVASDIVWFFDDPVDRLAMLSPWMVDLLPLPGPIVLTAAVLLLIRESTSSAEHSWNIDAFIIATGAGILCWVFLIAPQSVAGLQSFSEQLGSIAHPFVDILILALAIRMALTTGVRARSFHFISASLGLLVAADLLYARTTVSDAFVIAQRIDALWLLSYLLLGLAALHPSMNGIATPAAEPTLGLSPRRLILLGSATLLAPTALVIQRSRGEDVSVSLIVFGATLLALLVILRLNALVRVHQRVVTRERILRNAAATLVAATNRRATFDAAFTAIAALIKDASVLIAVRDEPAGPFTIASLTDDIDVSALGATLSPSIFASSLSRSPQGQGSVRLMEANALALRRMLGFPLNNRVLLLAPLIVQQELRGMLVIGNGNITDDVALGIEALGSQVALALESEALVYGRSQSHSEERFRSLVRHASDIIAIVEPDGRFRYVSPSVERILGHDADSLLATDICALVPPEQQSRVREFVQDVARVAGHNPLAEFRMEHADGAWLHFEAIGNSMLHDPAIAGIVLNIRDITERTRAEDLLAHQAFHDTLTNLPNRALFLDRLAHALARLARHRRSVAVLFVDLDRFKVINDSLGHDIGDQLLIAAGQRIAACMRQGDTCARLGGDEFTVLLEDMYSLHDATAVADRIIEVFKDPFIVAGHSIFISTSIGIAVSRPGIAKPSDLLREADGAMYTAKAKGKAGYAIFDPSMTSNSSERLDLENSLRRAIEAEQFTLLYQPQIELDSGRLASFEVLVRWAQPERGIVSPGEFIPLAEETGLILPLGRWVLEAACRQGRIWQDQFPNSAPEIGVNLSVRQFQDPNLVNDVARVLQETGLHPWNLALEITETGLMDGGPANIMLLNELKALGVRLAIDDFGIGYSSLSYLKGFPIDVLKIDRSFVERLDENEQDTAIVQAINSLAHTLGMRVVAEGIETAGQFNRV